MGLDATAYRGVSVANDTETDSDGEPIEWRRYRKLWDNRNFPAKISPFKHGDIITWEDSFTFRAGSYRMFNRFREQIAMSVGLTSLHAAKNNPRCSFYDFLWFADNAGTIGTTSCNKLAVEFEYMLPILIRPALATGDEDGLWFSRSYLNWCYAFRVGADRGCVVYH